MPRIRYQPQASMAECGAACLAMVLTYFGHGVSVREMRDRLHVGRDGTSAGDLVRAAREAGLDVQGRRCAGPELWRAPLPGIAFVRRNHFVVVERATPRGAVVVDPAYGRTKVTLDAFDREYSNVVLTFAGAVRRRRRPERPGLPRFLMDQLPRRPHVFTVIALASLLITALGLVPALVTAYTVDTLVPRGATDLVMVSLLALALVVLGRLAVGFVRATAVVRLQTALDEQLTTRFVEHLFRLPMRFYDLRTGGDLLNRVRSNAVVRDVLTTRALVVFLDLITAAVYFGLLGFVAPRFAVLVALVAAGQVALLVATARPLLALSRREIQLGADENSTVLEALTGIESVKMSALEEPILGRWRRVFAAQIDTSRRRQLLEGRLDDVTDVVQLALGAAIVLYGAYSVIMGDVSLGAMLAGAYVGAGVLAPLANLVKQARSFQFASVHLTRLRDVLQEAPEIQPSARRTDRLNGEVELRGVTFSYGGPGRPTIDDVSLRIPTGSFVAIAGASGSGKSTIARLMLGLHRPQRGTIRVGGRDIAGLSRAEVAGQCGAVAQEPAVFSGTILDNILIARDDATEADAREAARLAEFDRDIAAMPMGYQTLLSERGRGLSGGQRQRLALARALIRRPWLLVLDEATSSIDSDTELKILANLRSLDCTLVVIAHRLSTIRSADHVVLLESGRIVEAGSHADLLQRDGRYAALIERQRLSV